jgi:hypothetical protein
MNAVYTLMSAMGTPFYKSDDDVAKKQNSSNDRYVVTIAEAIKE